MNHFRIGGTEQETGAENREVWDLGKEANWDSSACSSSCSGRGGRTKKVAAFHQWRKETRHFSEAVRALQLPAGHLFDGMPQRGSRSSTGGEDRISALPDAVLQHVLGFLPADEVVRTSVVATRWRHLWSSVGRLRIHCP
ncbi:unnamed protein product [Urochloa humidicola]